MNIQNSLPNFFKLITVFFLVAVLAACGTSKKRGGYYQNDGPSKRKVDVNSIPNATPRYESYKQATLKPYKINGKRYVPLTSADGFVEEGRASWYGKQYHGRKTSTGEVYDMFQMTAAHPTLPLPTYVRVTNVSNQRSIIVRVNDRGPFIGDRIIDLSYVAAKKLGVVSAGTGNVIVESVSVNQNSQPSRSAITGSQLNPNSQVKQSQPNQQSAQTGLPVGAIPAAKPSSDYRYNLPASESQATPNSTIQNQRQKQQTQQSQLPQLVPSKPATNQTGPQYGQTGQSQWIQVGAFSVLQNAQQLLTRLKVSGYQNAQVTQQGNLYKVLIGPLSDQQMLTTKQSLKNNGYPAVRIQR